MKTQAFCSGWSKTWVELAIFKLWTITRDRGRAVSCIECLRMEVSDRRKIGFKKSNTSIKVWNATVVILIEPIRKQQVQALQLTNRFICKSWRRLTLQLFRKSTSPTQLVNGQWWDFWWLSTISMLNLTLSRKICVRVAPSTLQISERFGES